MFLGSLLGSAVRAGTYRQASRVYGSGSGRQFHAFPQIRQSAGAFSGLVKNSKIAIHLDSSVFGNLGAKLGFAKMAESVSLPCALSFKRFIHSGDEAEAEAGRTPRPMDYLRGLRQEIGNGVNGQPLYPPQAEAGRTPRSMDYLQGLHQETRNGVNGRPSLYPPQAEAGRTARSMDYVRGLLQEERGIGVNEQPRLYQPRVGTGGTPMDHARGLLHERGTALNGRSPLYQPQVESNADIVHIKLGRNNSYVTLTDSKGNRKIGISAGLAAAKGDKPGRYSGEAAAEYIGNRVREMKIRSVVVKVSGFTFFRRKKDAILAFKDGYTQSRGDKNPIVYIEDTTRKPHNGCRLPKKRRI